MEAILLDLQTLNWPFWALSLEYMQEEPEFVLLTGETIIPCPLFARRALDGAHRPPRAAVEPTKGGVCARPGRGALGQHYPGRDYGSR